MEPFLVNEPATEKEYRDAITKGEDLLTKMRAAGNQTLSSSFTAIEDLSKYGYSGSGFSTFTEDSDVAVLESTFRDLGINAKLDDQGGSFTKIQHKHDREYTDEKDVQYPVSHPFSSNTYANRNRPQRQNTINIATPPTA
jgi:hypothetical protein